MRKNRKEKAAKEDRSARLIRTLSFFVVLCLVFAAGFFVRGNDVVMQRLGLEDLSVESSQNPGATVEGDTQDSVSARVAEVQGILKDYSLDEYPLDTTSTKLVEDLLAATGDTYCRYYSAAKYSAYRESDSENTYGIGVLFGDYNGQAYVVDLIDGGPAQAAGVRQGDFIQAINGEAREGGWTVEEAVKAIEGDENSSIVITWRRPATLDATGGTEFTTTLTRKDVLQNNVTTDYDSDQKVGYIKVRQLGEDVDSYVSKAVDALKSQGAKSYVLDLRDVAGGYLTQAVNVASIFQASGVVVRIQTKDATSSRSVSGNALTDAPLVVLVNGNTAAAAEVLASSLQDSNRATIVGTTTSGRGTAQVMRELSFGGAVSYTAARYLTSEGRSFDGTGIKPDIKVEAGADDTDTQRQVAQEEAASLVSG